MIFSKSPAKVRLNFDSAKFLGMFFLLLLMQMPYAVDFAADGDVVKQSD